MEITSVEIKKYDSNFSNYNKIGRILWNICYWLLYRPFGLNIFNGYRNLLLKLFGAKIGKGAIVHSNAKIWAPWNLILGSYSCIGPTVDCYNQGKISIGNNTTISQKSYLCASSHNISSAKHTLSIKPIEIKDQVWVAADAFIGPGVLIEQGVVVAARSAVFKNVSAWTVVSGNPAVFIKKRNIND